MRYATVAALCSLIESRTVGARESLVIELAPGGGYVARITR